MQKLKFISAFICMAVIVSLSSMAFAAKIAIVDMEKIVENYTVAQEVAADLKVKDKELQEFIVSAQEKIKAAKTPLEKTNIEKKLTEQFNIKKNAFAKEQAEKWQDVESNVIDIIEKVAKEKKYEMVLDDKGVLYGGEDISDAVIKKLNTEAKE